MRMLAEKDVRARFGGLGRTTLWKLKKSDPAFPQPVEITPGVKRYVEAEIQAYLERLAARRGGAA